MIIFKGHEALLLHADTVHVIINVLYEIYIRLKESSD